MKKLIVYFFLMAISIIILPMIIVKGCHFSISKLSSKESEHLKVKVYMHNENKVKKMDLEEYLVGVVAAEMPADFEFEALKAQAIAARTYAYGRIKGIYSSIGDVNRGAMICTDAAHCQAWKPNKDAVINKSDGIALQKNWNKFSKAVEDTKGIIIFHNNSIINPLFHSNSGGKTENIEDVWDVSKAPYLISVSSPGEQEDDEFKQEVFITRKEFIKKLSKHYPKIKFSPSNLVSQIKIEAISAGARVKSIKIANIYLKGTDVRRIFGLQSSKFNIEEHRKDEIKITTYGNGHGVGMSQWGANYMAKQGRNYEEILKHYYTGTVLGKI